MAINQNHVFDDLDGVKCAVVEKNVSKDRIEFLRRILQFNGYTVVVVPTPLPKAAPAKPVSPAVEMGTEEPAAAPETFTLGVTDVMFNPVNAIFGRLLKLPDGRVVTLAYWHQKEAWSHDDIPYFNTPGSNQEVNQIV